MNNTSVVFILIEQLCCTVEDVTKDAVVDFIFFVVRFFDADNIAILESHLTA